jgi:hypothetical protein
MVQFIFLLSLVTASQSLGASAVCTDNTEGYYTISAAQTDCTGNCPYWVSLLKERWTRCADGSWKHWCYVHSIDWTNSGLSDSEYALDSHPVVLHASLAQRKVGHHRQSVLLVSELFKKVIHVIDPDLACVTNDDCTSTGYPYSIDNRDACYCPACPTTVLNVTATERNHGDWNRYCPEVDLRCTPLICIPTLPTACVKGQCQVYTSP